jgi:hypothetical protein
MTKRMFIRCWASGCRPGTLFATAYELRTSVRANGYPVNLSRTRFSLLWKRCSEGSCSEDVDGFRFKIDLLRLWIRRSHSIWQVVKK